MIRRHGTVRVLVITTRFLGREDPIRRAGPARTSVVLCAVLLAACASLPSDHVRTATHADLVTGDTRLGRAVAPLVDRHGGLSGIYLIERGLDAFAARVALGDAAERSLDLQYFLWHRDTTGRLLADAILRAADRGVRVRVLLDDVGTAASDTDLLLLDAHPGIEVRLFNPIANRRMRTASFLLDLARANRRMHNKSFTADNQVTILGGRNIGDEYFEASAALDFGDRDLVAIGPVVAQVSSQYDLYWNSEAAVPIAALAPDRPGAEAVTRARADLHAFVEAQSASVYVAAVRGSAIVTELRSRSLPLSWGPATVVHDDPAKIATAASDRTTHLAPTLRPVLDAVRDEVILVSPYFVPGEHGVSVLRDLRERGVRVRILTNSLAATDVAAVHSGYQRYRPPLLEAGVELHEAMPTARRAGDRGALRDREEREGDDRPWTSGSARALHAKAMIFDRRLVFLGSMNLDPRSLMTNTEIGVLVESAEAARVLVDDFERAIAASAYRLVLSSQPGTPASRIEWIAPGGGADTRYTSEPLASAWQRFKVWLLSLLPIEPLL